MLPRPPRRMWPDAGSYGTQLAKRINASARIREAAAKETYDEIQHVPDTRLQQYIEKKKAECIEASDICNRSGDSEGARFWELKSLMIDSSWSKKEIREYFSLVEKRNGLQHRRSCLGVLGEIIGRVLGAAFFWGIAGFMLYLPVRFDFDSWMVFIPIGVGLFAILQGVVFLVKGGPIS